MLRAGVSFPGIMKLLGHSSPDMTMRYLGVALPDLQREYQQARSQPRHRYPNRSNQIGTHRSTRAGRRTPRCTTCPGDVSPHAAGGRFPPSPGPPCQPAHQDGLRSAYSRNTRQVGRDWPVKRATRTVQCHDSRPEGNLLRGLVHGGTTLIFEALVANIPDDAEDENRGPI
jgi:hypothetical protein